MYQKSTIKTKFLLGYFWYGVNCIIVIGGIMFGAVVGDIIGSRFEGEDWKSKDFELFTDNCCFTDDSVMTLAVAQALIDCNGDYRHLEDNAISCMINIGRYYPNCGYGGHFGKWILYDDHTPYNSYGNGAAMRVSACGFVAKSLDEAKMLSYTVTKVSHNHYEGIKGAEATAVCIYLARSGKSKEEIKKYVQEHYYPLDFTLDQIRPKYGFDESCQGTVPQAFEAFLESSSFEDAIRNVISIGGDADTLAAITGGIAEAYYGVPKEIGLKALDYLDDRLLQIITKFETMLKSK